jgi:hypothetical protein
MKWLPARLERWLFRGLPEKTVSPPCPRSNYKRMAVAGTFNGWRPDLDYLKLVNDYAWQGAVWIDTCGTHEFKFAADGTWAANWGSCSGRTVKAPAVTAACPGQGNMKLVITRPDFYFFMFNERSNLIFVDAGKRG